MTTKFEVKSYETVASFALKRHIERKENEKKPLLRRFFKMIIKQ